MKQNNFTSRKLTQNNAKNSKLLTLLTNRQRAKSVPNLKNDWPGILNPNFAANVKFNSTSSSNEGKFRKSNSLFIPYKLQLAPITSVTLSGGLSLKPDFSSKLVFKRQTTSKQSGRFSSSKDGKKMKKVPIIKIQQNEESMSKSNIFRNTTISSKVNQIIDKQACFTARANAKSSINKIIYERTFLNPMSFNNTQKTIQLSNNGEKERVNANQFKVDFLAFGFVQKIIDNPELWGKYVHKMKEHNQKPANQNKQIH